MSELTCHLCRNAWDATRAPLCPHCEATRLQAVSGLIREKHHPGTPRAPGFDYRSFLARGVVEAPRPYLREAVERGDWFYSVFHGTWNLVVTEPLDRSPGLGLHAGESTPDHTLDSLLLADVLGNPHLFAIDRSDVGRKVDEEEWLPLARCATPACGNLCLPGGVLCAQHEAKPRASGSGPRRLEP